MTRHKHRPDRPPAQWGYVYDGRDLFAVVEHRADGWHATLHNGNVDLGTYASREQAIGRINAHKVHIPAAPLADERERDVARTKTIRQHRKREREQRASMGGRKRKTATT